eukprot:TRINITY_DN1593_c0_g1_i1.p2 TRINITY_DN1593_c0_g1~~TRINITY_DN1593_c0_g1_i1.p2  ORF type:complete len:162 (-),score=24.88 TRINITY_DN1593_c0_g1_i1:38-523(-)
MEVARHQEEELPIYVSEKKDDPVYLDDQPTTDPPSSLWQRLKKQAKLLKRETIALYLASQDPRTPLAAKILAFIVVAYAFCPIDLIPDFIPILGYLDDIILVPIGIYICLKMIPQEVMEDCRLKADISMKKKRTTQSMICAALIVLLYISLGWALVKWFFF